MEIWGGELHSATSECWPCRGVALSSAHKQSTPEGKVKDPDTQKNQNRVGAAEWGEMVK